MQSELIVNFDPKYLSFEEDLNKVSFEKIVTIHYSEEILQTNFSIILKILKQLNLGMTGIYSEMDRYKELFESAHGTSNQQNDLVSRLEIIETQQEEQKQELIEIHNTTQLNMNTLKQHDTEIEILRDQISSRELNSQMSHLKEEIEFFGERMTRNEQLDIQQDALIQSLKSSLSSINDKLSQPYPQGLNYDLQIQEINNDMHNLRVQLKLVAKPSNNNVIPQNQEKKQDIQTQIKELIVLFETQNQVIQTNNDDNQSSFIDSPFTSSEDFKNYVKINNQRVQDIETKLSQIQLTKIYVEIQILNEAIDKLKRDNESINKKLKDMKKITETLLTKEQIIELITNQFIQLKTELLEKINSVAATHNKKANQEDLVNVENNLLQRLEDLVQSLVMQFANKKETKKALIYLESKINDILVMIEGEQQQSSKKEGEGLFVKRPLIWSCASCDKDLDQFKGNLGDFKAWAVFPPKETSPERLEFGVGLRAQQEKVRGVNRSERKDKMEKIHLEQHQSYQKPISVERPRSNHSQTEGNFYVKQGIQQVINSGLLNESLLPQINLKSKQ